MPLHLGQAPMHLDKFIVTIQVLSAQDSTTLACAHLWVRVVLWVRCMRKAGRSQNQSLVQREVL